MAQDTTTPATPADTPQEAPATSGRSLSPLAITGIVVASVLSAGLLFGGGVAAGSTLDDGRGGAVAFAPGNMQRFDDRGTAKDSVKQGSDSQAPGDRGSQEHGHDRDRDRDRDRDGDRDRDRDRDGSNRPGGSTDSSTDTSTDSSN
jgi:hypothetical protein